MRKILLYAPILLVVLFFLSMNKAGNELHWKYIVEKILIFGFVLEGIYLINRLIRK